MNGCRIPYTLILSENERKVTMFTKYLLLKESCFPPRDVLYMSRPNEYIELHRDFTRSQYFDFIYLLKWLRKDMERNRKE